MVAMISPMVRKAKPYMRPVTLAFSLSLLALSGCKKDPAPAPEGTDAAEGDAGVQDAFLADLAEAGDAHLAGVSFEGIRGSGHWFALLARRASEGFQNNVVATTEFDVLEALAGASGKQNTHLAAMS